MYLVPQTDDRRVVEILKITIRQLIADDLDISRNHIEARAKIVKPPSGRKPGLAKSTLDRNPQCRAIFQIAMTHEARRELRHKGSIDAHIARQTRDQLFALLGSYRQRTDQRRIVLDNCLERLKKYGQAFDISTLNELEWALRGHRAAKQPVQPNGLKKAGSAAAGRSYSLVRRSIARMRNNATRPTYKNIVQGTAQFNGGVAISASTISRNVDCRRLVDEAVRYGGPARVTVAPSHYTKRDIAEAVQASRLLWRETRRLSFLVTDALADLEDPTNRAAAAERASAHYEAEAEAARIIAASSAARS